MVASALPYTPAIPEEFAMREDTLEPLSASAHEPRIGRSVSLDHAAEMLGVSRRTIYNRIREGRLLTIRTLGGSQRVLLDSVQADSRASRPTSRDNDF
jgi:excisionase family DNA binding protein